MKDALDQDGIWDAIRDAGLDLPERPHPSDLGGRLVNVFLKCEADPTGYVRGRRNAMLDDSDVYWHRQIKATVGGVAASVTGDPAVFVSVAAVHQGPTAAARSPRSSAPEPGTGSPHCGRRGVELPWPVACREGQGAQTSIRMRTISSQIGEQLLADAVVLVVAVVRAIASTSAKSPMTASPEAASRPASRPRSPAWGPAP